MLASTCCVRVRSSSSSTHTYTFVLLPFVRTVCSLLQNVLTVHMCPQWTGLNLNWVLQKKSSSQAPPPLTPVQVYNSSLFLFLSVELRSHSGSDFRLWFERWFLMFWLLTWNYVIIKFTAAGKLWLSLTAANQVTDPDPSQSQLVCDMF